MFLVAPYGTKRKWDIRFRNHDGRVVKVSGDRDQTTARRIGERIEMLVRAKQHGDSPPGDLASWIDNMPEALAQRLVDLQLLDARRFDRNKPFEDHIVEYGRIVAARKSNGARHARQQEAKVRRICTDLKIAHLNDLSATTLMEHLKSLKIATSTRRSYIITMKDFAGEMKQARVIRENPFEHVIAPGAYENPEYERQPLTVAQFQALTKHLGTFTRYRNQKSRWTASDRKMIYWTAVRTAYRQSEMRALVKANLHLDSVPPVITLKARHTKNKTSGEVAIASDLAEALREYTKGLEPTDKVFPFPRTCGSIVDMLRLDLKGAGIPWKLPTGEIIDFHTLRSTAITWWLTVDGRLPMEVQVLARLQTLALVQNYSRNFRIADWDWLNKGPTLVDPQRKQA